MEEVNKLRNKIDKIDNEINKNLNERMEVVKELKRIKKEQSIPTEDRNREAEILAKCKNKYTEAIFKEMLKQSKNMQNDV